MMTDDRQLRRTAPATTYTMKVTANLFWAAVLATALSSCAYNETTNNYTINGDNNSVPTTQTPTTSKPVDVSTAGSGYGAASTTK